MTHWGTFSPDSADPFLTTGSSFASPPETKWEWQPFGDDWLKIYLPTEPSWLARLACKLVLGSKWKRLPEKTQ